MRKIENTIATSLENLDLVVEAFHETAIFSVNKKVGDFLPPATEQADEFVETRNRISRLLGFYRVS
jgi:hypothetical protein